MARILVTAATGRVGSALLPQLIEGGHDVRAVTSREAAGDGLLKQGAIPVVADIKEPESLSEAVADVDAVFLATADDPRQDRIEVSLVEMIKQRGSPHVIKLSAQSAGLTPPVSFGTMHREAETALEHSGLPYTILRPTFFQQSLLLFAEDVAKKKRIIAPVGSGRVAMVDVSDVARTAAAVVCNDDHYNKTYVLTGPSAHSFGDIVGLMSNELGHAVAYTSPPAFLARLVLPMMTGMPRWKSNLVVDLLSALRAGAQENVSADVERVTGTPPSALRSFITSHAGAFRS